MQHLKLSIKCLNQTFLYKGNFKDVDYVELQKFASSKLGSAVPQWLQFIFTNQDGVTFIIDDDQKLQEIKKFQLPVVKLILKEQEEMIITHPNATCFKCQQSPIQNIRYKCLVCDNMDLCSKCLDHGSIHPLLMISKPEQEQFLQGYFASSIKKVQSLLNCSISTSKNTVVALKDAIVKKKQNIFGDGNKKIEQSEFQQKQQFVKPPTEEEQDLTYKTLRLAEIFEDSPSKYEKFVKKYKKLSIEELIELASEQYA